MNSLTSVIKVMYVIFPKPFILENEQNNNVYSKETYTFFNQTKLPSKYVDYLYAHDNDITRCLRLALKIKLCF